MDSYSRFGWAAALLLAACTAPPTPAPVLEFSGPPGSGKSFLAAGPEGTAVLSWLEPAGEGRAALKVAMREAAGWSEARTVAAHERFFVNWADFPSVVTTTDDRLVVHWLEKTAARPYAYHVMLSTSTDRGATWSPPLRAHTDTSSTEHGFAALQPRTDGGVDLVWLDGRAMTGEHAGTMQVRFGTLHADGTLGPETLLDDRSCECCQTRMARTASGLVVAYRDRTTEEVRDISVARFAEGRWHDPTPVSGDGWVHRACPVNGPGLDARGDRVGLAWYTQADSVPRLLFAWSTDGGATFSAPIRLDAGDPVGRAELLVDEDGSARVAWLEGTGDQGAEWRLVRVDAAGTVGPATVLHRTARTRDAGFVRMTRVGPALLASLTAVGDTGGVRVLRLDGR